MKLIGALTPFVSVSFHFPLSPFSFSPSSSTRNAKLTVLLKPQVTYLNSIVMPDDDDDDDDDDDENEGEADTENAENE